MKGNTSPVRINITDIHLRSLLELITTRMAILVCSKLATTRVQACSKLTKALKSAWNELAARLPCKLIANYSRNRVRTQPRIEIAIYRFRSRRLNHSAS
ncbi:hypothetical protein AVEN_181910-1 [Araneus ventricosus]|uniref:Uncharacterized protein n=1 Tax=Araneus ventricosus TaxID=182803 RepID=A0A4Y2RSC3_ARAVE|nr:hypothetical protein AVEN_181910-1 [Araneus ventricosus]